MNRVKRMTREYTTNALELPKCLHDESSMLPIHGITRLAVLVLFGIVVCLACGCASADKKIDMKRYPRVRSWAFPAVDSARLVTLSGDLLSTDDGGRNWSTLIGAEFGKFYSVCFLDTQFGWANTRNGQVFRTRDGGLSWERIATVDDETGPTLGAIGFRDRENGWMIDPFEFWRTTDGGATWLKLTPKDAGPSQGFYCAFNTPSTGWI